MRPLLLAVAMAALTCPPAAAQPGANPMTAYRAAGGKASKPLATIAYGKDSNQVADLRLPVGSGPHPVAVVVHGGCWHAALDSRSGMGPLADALGRRGFATWTVGYRRLGNPGGGWPGTFQDVAAAVDKLADVAATHRLDLSRVIVVGHSSGAHLALWAASRHKLAPPWSAPRVRPLSVAAIDGPGDLAPFVGIDAQVCGEPVIVPLMGGTPQERPEAYSVASPARQLPLGVRQLFVPADLGEIMQPYIEAARRSGDAIEVLQPTGANHFDIVTPGTPNGEAVADFIAAKALPGLSAR